MIKALILSAALCFLPVISSCGGNTVINYEPEPQEEQTENTENTENETTRLRLTEILGRNKYARESFTATDDGFVRYADENAAYGIDVSAYQEEIDWQKVKDAGVDFAIIRVGYRGYTKGVISEDEHFEANITNALEAGVRVGAYFFSQAVNAEEAEEEAGFVLEKIGGYDVSYPVVFDWEPISNDEARTNGVTGKVMTDCAEAFCKKIKEAGYDACVYFNSEQGYLHYDLTRLRDYVFWFADYSDYPTFFFDFDMWQYSCTGRIDGIGEDVCLNISFLDVAKKEKA